MRCDQQSDGTVTPKELIWPDGRSWEIRKTLHMAAPVEDEFEGIVLGGLMLIVFGCIVFIVIQHTWYSMAILIAMEIFLVMITAGAGLIEGLLDIASDSLGGFMRS